MIADTENVFCHVHLLTWCINLLQRFGSDTVTISTPTCAALFFITTDNKLSFRSWWISRDTLLIANDTQWRIHCFTQVWLGLYLTNNCSWLLVLVMIYPFMSDLRNLPFFNQHIATLDEQLLVMNTLHMKAVGSNYELFPYNYHLPGTFKLSDQWHIF